MIRLPVPEDSPPPRRRSPFRRRGCLVVLAVLALAGGVSWWIIDRRDRPEQAPPPVEPDKFSKVEEERALMGTTFRAVVYALDEDAARTAIAEAFARAEEIADICTDYDPESELSQLSSAPVDRSIKVSPTLATVLAHAVSVAEATGGYFDPTMGPLTRLWRRTRDTKTLPTGDELTAALARTGWKHLEVDQLNNTVRLTKEGMALDLGGIAKGYAADEMLAVLQRGGFPSALIVAGGDVRVGTPPPGRSSWRVGLRTLGGSAVDYIEVSNCAVSTSGDLHQFVDIEGTRYSHILDPTTGLGLTRRVAATVVAPEGVMSDPFATFACVVPDVAFNHLNAGTISLRLVVEVEGHRKDQQTLNFPEIRVD